MALRNVVIGGNLISLQLLTEPRQLVETISSLLFHYKTLTGKGRLEQKNPNQIFGNEGKYEIKVDTTSHFWGTDSSYTKDFITLCILAKAINAKRIFEIGTLTGVSAIHFAMNTEDDAEIYTLDLPPDGSLVSSLNVTCIDEAHQKVHSMTKRLCFEGTSYHSKIHCLIGDSATYDYGSFHDKIDLFFIDGAHSYEYVKSDTANALRCVHRGGVILWHDYGRMGVNGVTKWLHEFASHGHKVYSVPGSSLAYHVVTR